MMTWIDRRKSCSWSEKKRIPNFISTFHSQSIYQCSVQIVDNNYNSILFIIRSGSYFECDCASFLFGAESFLADSIYLLYCLSQGNTMKLLWTYNDKDPVYGHLKWHGTFSGVRSIHMLTPLWKKPSASHNANNRDTRQWDVTVKNVSYLLFCTSLAMLKLWSRQ